MAALLFSAIPAAYAAIAENAAGEKCSNAPAKTATAMAQCSNVATAQKPAIYQLENPGEGAKALEVTAQPLTEDTSSGFLVQVFAESGVRSTADAPKFLGSFSFYPAQVGEAQTFVLPNPAAYGISGNKLTLSIRLVSANAARPLPDTAVEILGAKFVR